MRYVLTVLQQCVMFGQCCSSVLCSDSATAVCCVLTVLEAEAVGMALTHGLAVVDHADLVLGRHVLVGSAPLL